MLDIHTNKQAIQRFVKLFYTVVLSMVHRLVFIEMVHNFETS